MSAVRVACCQLELAVGERDANRAAVSAAVRQAAAEGARVVVVPELASSGYVFRDADEARSLAEPADGPTVTAWAELAAELGVVLVAGFCERGEEDRLHNSAVLADASGVRAVYRKAHLWDREKLVFEPGDAPPPLVDTDTGRIAVMICYDLEFPEWARISALAGADMICAPANWPAYPRPAGERPAEVVRVQALASVNRIFVAACDRARSERGQDWVGGSVIVDPGGWPLAGPLDGARPGTIIAACELASARDKRISEHNDVHADRRPELYDAAGVPSS